MVIKVQELLLQEEAWKPQAHDDVSVAPDDGMYLLLTCF